MDYLNSPEFQAHVKELMDEHHVPGLSIALAHNGETTSIGFGQASIDPPKPCTADTLFDIASSSKSLTAASVALLVHDDENHPEIDWDMLMSKLLPEDFVMEDERYTESITVEDILSHRTGMPSHDSSYMSPRATNPDDARSVTRNLRNLVTSDPLRSTFIYNNIMFTVATHLVEVKSKKTFSDFLEERFFQPLEMHDTSLQPFQAKAKGHGERIAIGHAWDADTGDYLVFPAADCPEAQGAGSIITSAKDYLKWVNALMNQEGPITEDIYEELTTPRSIEGEPSYPLCSADLYTLGLEVFYYRGHKIVRHQGLVSGFGSRHFFLPEFKFGGVILGNSNQADNLATILFFELVDEVLNVPKSERTDWNTFETNRVAKGKADFDEDNTVETLREQLCPGLEESQPQETPLSAYTGYFHNVGYHTMCVEIRQDQLYIDASDRSNGFYLTFDHVCDQTKYIAHMRSFEEGGDDLLKAEFVFSDGKATRLGIQLEEELDEYIWFDRI